MVHVACCMQRALRGARNVFHAACRMQRVACRMQRFAWRIQAGGFVAPSSAQPLRAFARDQRVITVAAGAQHTLVLACAAPRLADAISAAPVAAGCAGAVLAWGFGRNAEAQLGGEPSATPVAEPRVLVRDSHTVPRPLRTSSLE